MSKEAMKLALEALKELTDCGAEAWGATRPCVYDGYQAIKALEEALAKQKHEEMVSKARYNRLRDDYNEAIEILRLAALAAKKWEEHVNNCQVQGVDLDCNFALAKQEHGEPVAEIVDHGGYAHVDWKAGLKHPVGTKFYTTPQQRTWVGLTDEEIEDCYKQGGIGRAAQMLKEKNT